MGSLLKLWKDSSKLDRAAVALVVLLILSAFCTWPLVSKLLPELAVIASYTRNDEVRTDPWGRAIVIRDVGIPTDPRAFVYSLGPNGSDEAGSGDDIILFDQLKGRGPSGRVHASALLLSQSLGFFMLLALFVAGTYYSARRGAPARKLGKELTRALMLSVPLGVLASTMAFLSSYTLIKDDARAAIDRQLILPSGVALVGSVFVVTFLAILTVRLVHSKEGLQKETNERKKPETLEEAAKRWLPEG